MPDKNEKSVFSTLNDIDVSKKVKQKNKLTYLPWSSAWAEVCKIYPDATFKLYFAKDQFGEETIPYWTDGKTCWVKCSVTINGIERREDAFPIMDFKNQPIPLSKVTITDVNKSIQRAKVKCIAQHGLGIYIYEGEEIPESVKEEQEKQEQEKAHAIWVSNVKKLLGQKGVPEEYVCKMWKAENLEAMTDKQLMNTQRSIDKFVENYEKSKEGEK